MGEQRPRYRVLHVSGFYLPHLNAVVDKVDEFDLGYQTNHLAVHRYYRLCSVGRWDEGQGSKTKLSQLLRRRHKQRS
jgi:hypothetical protein